MSSAENTERAYAALVAAAEAGEPCPENKALGRLMIPCMSGPRAVFHARNAVARLVRQGRIFVLVPGQHRQVEIAASGARTAPRIRERGSDLSALPPKPRPVRDTCFRCGTRAELHGAHGCGRFAIEPRYDPEGELAEFLTNAGDAE